MPAPGPARPAGRDRRPLRRSLVAGAVYDLALGLFIVLFGPRALVALGYPVPDPVFLFYLSGLALFILPVLYGAASRAAQVDPFRAPVLWARAGGGAFILLVTLLFPPPGAWIYAGVAAADLVWAAVHAALWNRDR